MARRAHHMPSRALDTDNAMRSMAQIARSRSIVILLLAHLLRLLRRKLQLLPQHAALQLPPRALAALWRRRSPHQRRAARVLRCAAIETVAVATAPTCSRAATAAPPLRQPRRRPVNRTAHVSPRSLVSLSCQCRERAPSAAWRVGVSYRVVESRRLKYGTRVVSVRMPFAD